MKPFLLFEGSESNINKRLSNEDDLSQDLNLHIVFKAMAQNDAFLYDTARRIVLDSQTDIVTINYRQDILKDCISHKSVMRGFYAIASSALKEAAYYLELNQPNYARIVPMAERVQKALGLLEIFVAKLEELKNLCCISAQEFRSQGLATFCSSQAELLTDEFFVKVKEHISDLKSLSQDGRIVIGSGIGNGMKGARHVLRRISNSPPDAGAKKKFLNLNKFESNIIRLDNISIANSAREIEDAGLVNILRVINHFTEDIRHFLEALRYESGFYVGCINLYEVLAEIRVPVCFPATEDINGEVLKFEGLYDISMAVEERKRLVANDFDAENKRLLVITGANQGGKSTYLRSIGLAQILMQCGIMLLMNESFATTTERDGAKIARDIVTALYELDVKVLFVTHLFEFSNYMYGLNLEKAVFLRAERNDDGCRTFSIKLGRPLQTSYGEDLYVSVIGKGIDNSINIDNSVPVNV